MVKPDYMKKVKLPTQAKTIYVWCRNCNKKNATRKINVIFFGTCIQCGVSLARASEVKLK
jgi:Zn finger protein HypA/HybF involved in hydrogenase expression